jgi:hypothetical protein
MKMEVEMLISKSSSLVYQHSRRAEIRMKSCDSRLKLEVFSRSAMPVILIHHSGLRYRQGRIYLQRRAVYCFEDDGGVQLEGATAATGR